MQGAAPPEYSGIKPASKHPSGPSMRYGREWAKGTESNGYGLNGNRQKEMRDYANGGMESDRKRR